VFQVKLFSNVKVYPLTKLWNTKPRSFYKCVFNEPFNWVKKNIKTENSCSQPPTLTKKRTPYCMSRFLINTT
jgi:hypothetical protein